MTNTQVSHKHYLLNTYPFRGKTFVRGKGVYLYDEDGNKYLDLITNYGVNIFGYKNSQITKALKEQLEQLPSLHCSFANDVRAEAAKLLVSRCGGKLRKVYFSNSGTEAVEAAIKFAFLASGKNGIIAAKDSYHGKTLASLSVTWPLKYKKGLEEILLDVEFVSYGDLKSLKNVLTENVAAVILEPIQGEAGIIIPSKGYLKSVQKWCEENDAILILDEIQTGVGRTGSFLASQKEGVSADIVCLGKGLAGGIPVGATLVSKKIARKVPKLSQTSTLGGNPLACRGIVEVLSLLDDKYLARIQQKGNLFMKKLKKIKNNKIIEIRGEGLMIGVEINGDRNRVLKELQNSKIIAAPAGENVVRFLPPYIISESDIDLAVSTLKVVISNQS